jgi:predicted dehydrogenase
VARLRVGIAGFGNMGQQFAQYLRACRADDVEIVGVSNRGPANRAVAERSFGLRATADIEELLAWGPDALLVASTTVAHAEQTVAAARRGVHVFCEKPIALTIEDADRMIRAATAGGIITGVNYSMRFIDAYLKIREMVRSGQLGTILSVTHIMTRDFGLYSAGARHRAVTEPEESGGWTVHHACHDLDFLYWINGEMTTACGVTATTVPGPGSEEVVHGLLTFAGGGVGTIGDSVCGIREHFTLVIGSAASVVLTGEKEQTLLRLKREGADRETLIPATDAKRKGGGLDDFVDCVRAGRRSLNDLRSARHSLAAALALRASAGSGRPEPIDRRQV